MRTSFTRTIQNIEEAKLQPISIKKEEKKKKKRRVAKLPSSEVTPYTFISFVERFRNWLCISQLLAFLSNLGLTPIQTYLRDTANLVPHHHNKANPINFLLSQCILKLCLHYSLLSVQLALCLKTQCICLNLKTLSC